MIRRTYDGWGYSPLSQIETGNVSRLEPVWGFSTGATNGHEGSPLVVNGVMFISTPGNQVVAINARTGTLLWRYRRPLPNPVVLNHPTSRGVAVYNDKVYFRGGRSGARGARCQDGRRGVDYSRGRQRERVLHVACAARGRRQGADRNLRG